MVDVLAPSAKMNAPGGSHYLHARHFTTPDEGAMHNQSTDCAPSKEERCLEAVKSGRISIDAEGRVWKHWRKMHKGGFSHYDPPRRADKADKIGYCRIGVSIDGKTVIVYAHRLIWVYHNGRIPTGLEVNHKDGNKQNNRLDNLELVTRAGNMNHAIYITKSWSDRHGEGAPLTKLNWENVCEIRRDAEAGATRKELAKRFNVTENCIRDVLLRITWKAKGGGPRGGCDRRPE